MLEMKKKHFITKGPQKWLDQIQNDGSHYDTTHASILKNKKKSKLE